VLHWPSHGGGCGLSPPSRRRTAPQILRIVVSRRGACWPPFAAVPAVGPALTGGTEDVMTYAAQRPRFSRSRYSPSTGMTRIILTDRYVQGGHNSGCEVGGHCLDRVFSRAPHTTIHESLTERSVHEKLSYCVCILLS